jgi:hypothetical protein
MTTLTEQGWYQWHAPYDALDTAQTERLGVVQEALLAYFDQARSGELRAVSVCAGQSRDLLPVLISHPRGADVAATMLELDELNASFLHGALGSTRLSKVEVVVGDAGLSDAFLGLVPADLLVMCGVFANIELGDAERTVDALPSLCAEGGTVVWSTYGASYADLDAVLARFESGPFERVSLVRTEEYAVAAHRFTGTPVPLTPSERLFRFRTA